MKARDKLFVRVAKSSAIRSKRWQSIAGCGTRFISDLENGKETIQFGKTLDVASMLGLDLSIDVRGAAR